MRTRSFAWILAALMLLLDTYAFQAVRFTLQHSSLFLRTIVYGIYWVVTLLALCLLMFQPYFSMREWPHTLRVTIIALLVGFYLAKLLTCVFLLVDDVRRGIQWLVERIAGSRTTQVAEAEVKTFISRSRFLTQLALLAGGGLFATFIYGFSNKYAYRVKRMQLHFPNLPSAFRGLKVLQISDIHSGSFDNKTKVAKGVQMILAEKADIIFFTGDLVNDRADEMKDYKELFSRVQAPMGVFSTLGNHDYGDYSRWESPAAKESNLEKLKAIHGEMGWRLMMNENEILEKDGQRIAVIGVENWSAKLRFPKHGDLKKASAGTENVPFKMLLSHDPSHWDAQVRSEYPDIDITFAGHTHGMQFGVEIPGFKWSPIQYAYKEWAGLYHEGAQYLYVNRGYGFLGYPGRVGILPEITVIELT